MKKRIIPLILALVLVLSLAACGREDKGVTVGSKQFTENILLGEIYAQLIEAKTDLKVTRKLNLGGTSVCIPAMEKGEIDLYFEYSGTAYNEILNHELQADDTADGILETCQKELKEKGMTFFDPLGLNNTYSLAVRSARAGEFGGTISALAPASPDLRFGAGHTFYTRVHDGYDGIVAAYGLNFGQALKMDTSLLYEAVDKGELDVIVVFGTDSLLKKYDMTILEDDKGVFPPYHGAPLCRSKALEAHPELGDVLNTLAGKIDNECIQELNYRVDVENRAVEDVAKEFLKENGYI